MALSPEAQERTGYHYFLFQKLQELVRQCDRTVSRNKEKLKQELSRKLSQRGGQDFVEDVDEGAVEALVRAMWQVEDLTQDYQNTIEELDQVVVKEEAAKKQLEPLLEEAKKKAESEQKEGEEGNDGNDDENLKALQLQLGKLTLEKQRLVFELSRTMSRLVPLQETVDSQHRTSHTVLSVDISDLT